MNVNFETVLILAPHTDDGELGCGGTIAKLLSLQKNVYYIAFSPCRRSLPKGLDPDTLEKELKNAAKILGIDEENVIIFDFDVRTFKENRQPILEEMINLRDRLKPDAVFAPIPTDIHQDHQVISEEGLRAFKNSTILGYEMPWNNTTFNTQAFVQLEESHLDLKIAALKEYKSQLHRDYLNGDFIRSLARVRGVQIGKKYAEAFEVIRIIM